MFVCHIKIRIWQEAVLSERHVGKFVKRSLAKPCEIQVEHISASPSQKARASWKPCKLSETGSRLSIACL